MATNFDFAINRQQNLGGETDSLLSHNKEPAAIIPPCRYYRARRVRSKGAILVLAWSFLNWACHRSVVIAVSTSLVVQPTLPISLSVFVQLLSAVLYPLAGWLADVYFGRYKVLRASLLLMWLGSVSGTLLFAICLLVTPTSGDALKNAAILLAYITVFIGTSGFTANIIPFGTDQILEASSEEISAFIHWFVWAWYAGRASAHLVMFLSCTCMDHDQASLVSMTFAVAVSSLALSLDFLCRNCLIVEPESRNPLKSVWTVLKYTAIHKRPARRSAFTYWEESIPSRIDLGKSKYGGPFTTEQVEDVKTFLRLLIVAVTVSIFFYPIEMYISSLYQLVRHFQWPTNLSYVDCYGQILVSNRLYILLTVLLIPLYELAVYPLARHLIPSALKRVGIGAFATIVLSCVAMSVDMIGHFRSSATVECVFAVNGNNSSTVHIAYLWIGVPFSIIIGMEILIINVSLFEFICAQTPYNMKGLVIGLTFSAESLAYALGDATLTAWARAWSQPATYPTCAFWFYLFVALVVVIALAIFCFVAKWYKKRERDEPQFEQRFVEDYYNKYI